MAWKDLTPKTFASIRELNGISARTQEEHYELYKGYVGKVNEIQKKLDAVDRTTANQIFSDLRSLRVDYSFAIGGMKNHEIFFAHLGGKGGAPAGRLKEQIARDFPSYDAWLADFKASGLAARGWVWLAYDHDLSMLTTVVGEACDEFGVCWVETDVAADGATIVIGGGVPHQHDDDEFCVSPTTVVSRPRSWSYASHTQPRAARPEALKSASHASYEG